MQVGAIQPMDKVVSGHFGDVAVDLGSVLSRHGRSFGCDTAVHVPALLCAIDRFRDGDGCSLSCGQGIDALCRRARISPRCSRFSSVCGCVACFVGFPTNSETRRTYLGPDATNSTHLSHVTLLHIPGIVAVLRNQASACHLTGPFFTEWRTVLCF